MPSLPNILWIQCDEIRADSLSCYPGNPWVRPITPHLQGVADAGLVFDNMFCPSPVCMPSRGSEMTSRPVTALGTFHNVTRRVRATHRFDLSHLTWLRVMRDAGYHTVNVGKLHIVDYDAWDENLGCPQFPNPRELVQQNPPELNLVVLPGIKLAVGGRYPLGDGDYESFGARRLTRCALDVIASRRASAQPWLVRVSYVAPHTPVIAPAPFSELHSPEQFASGGDSERPHGAMSAYERSFALTQRSGELSSEQVASARAAYHGLVSAIDNDIGLLLQQVGDDVIVLFTGDHGTMLGEMGLWQKQVFNRKVHQVPYLLRAPGVASGRRADNADLMDTGPTLLSLCGLTVPEVFEGRDLLAADSGARDVYSAFGYGDAGAFMYEALALGPDCPRRICLRRGPYRLDLSILRNGRRLTGDEQDVFFCDVRVDPEERCNAADNPDYAAILNDMRDSLIDWHDRTVV